MDRYCCGNLFMRGGGGGNNQQPRFLSRHRMYDMCVLSSIQSHITYHIPDASVHKPFGIKPGAPSRCLVIDKESQHDTFFVCSFSDIAARKSAAAAVFEGDKRAHPPGNKVKNNKQTALLGLVLLLRKKKRHDRQLTGRVCLLAHESQPTSELTAVSSYIPTPPPTHPRDYFLYFSQERVHCSPVLSCFRTVSPLSG